MTGRIKTIIAGRGFGFITAEGRDYFFHDDDVLDEYELQAGDRVQFEVVEPQPERGPRATSVQQVPV